MTDDWLLLLPRPAAERIKQGGRFGELSVAEEAGLAAVSAISSENGAKVPSGLASTHHLGRVASQKQGYWHRAQPDLHHLWMATAARGAAVPLHAVNDLLDVPLRSSGQNANYLLTYVRRSTTPAAADEESPAPPQFAAWFVLPEGLAPISVDVEVPVVSPLWLEPQWPARDLADAHVAVVGTGSIGSAAARELAQYGVGTLSLVDPDRLVSHNLVRHTLEPRDVGRHKVDALAEQLTSRRPLLHVNNYVLDIVTDTQLFRPLVEDADLVLCAADGVAPRRVVSHETHRAHTDAVLACVLMDGELGEVLRLRARDDEGCLLCRRAAQVSSGAVAAEAGIDLGYGTGNRHRPMTAVGSDLHLVGALAAKVTVATLLQARGHRLHRTAGEQAIIRLRGGLPHQPPFHAAYSGELVWSPADPPRTECATCAAS